MRSPAADVDSRLTYDDFVYFPDDGKRHEIIDGVHYVTPSPDVRHQAIVVRLVVEIATYLKHHPIGRVFVSPLDVVLSHHDIVEPDPDGKLTRVAELSADDGETLTTPLLPGCAIALRDLFSS